MNGPPRPLAVALALIAACACACDGGRPAASSPAPAAGAIGVSAVPEVHLLENHSSALSVWRGRGVHDRVLVHVDGHVDLDWLPDETVARIAAARLDELGALELHPYELDGTTLRKFAIWNFIYPAARLGLVREVVWVVPDGTLRDRESAAELVRELFLGKLQMVSLEEAKAIRLDGRVLHGELIGIPVTVCELADLPAFTEPVLLDVDLDYFTTRSAVTQEVTERPWMSPEHFVKTLEKNGVRADVATLSLSTIGGYLPPANRWLGPALADALRDPSKGFPRTLAVRTAVEALAASGDAPGALKGWVSLAESAPEDGTAWYGLSRAYESAGRVAEARDARARAEKIDPLLEHADLFEADRLWMNGAWAEALPVYRRYLETRPGSAFAPYARRREAGCLMRLDRTDEAIEAFRKVVAAAPRHGDSRLDLGVLLRERGRMDDAITEMRAARDILPDLASYGLALGTTFLQMGRFEDARRELEVAVARRPCWPPAQANLASALASTGHLDEARRHIDIAVTLAPSNPQFQQLAAAIRRASPK